MGVFAPPVAIDSRSAPQDAPLVRVNPQNAASLLLEFLRRQVRTASGRKVGRGYTTRQICHWFGDKIDVDATLSTSAAGASTRYLTELGLIDSTARHVFLDGIDWEPAPGDEGEPVVTFYEPQRQIAPSRFVRKVQKEKARLARVAKADTWPDGTTKQRGRGKAGVLSFGPPGCSGSTCKDYRRHAEYVRQHGEISWADFVALLESRRNK